MAKLVTYEDVKNALRTLARAIEESEDNSENEDKQSEGKDLTQCTLKQLYEMCVEKGLTVSKAGKSKQYYIEKLNGLENDEEPDDDDDDDDDDEKTDYKSMTAIQLYQLCKKRGIKAEQKLKASKYIALLEEKDAEEAEEEDWEEEEEEEAPAKKGKGGSVGKSKKTASDDEDDDDDWEI